MAPLRTVLTVSAPLLLLGLSATASAQVATAAGQREQNHAQAARCVPADAEFGAVVDIPIAEPMGNPFFTDEQSQRIQDAAFAFIEQRSGFDVAGLTSLGVWFNRKGDYGGCLVGGVTGLPTTGEAATRVGELDAVAFGEMVLAYADGALLFGTTDTLGLVGYAHGAQEPSPIAATLVESLDDTAMIVAVVQSPELSDEDDPGIAGLERVVFRVSPTALEADAVYAGDAQADTAYALYQVGRATVLAQLEQERAAAASREFGPALGAELAAVITTIFVEERLAVSVADATLHVEVPLDLSRMRPELIAVMASVAVPAFSRYVGMARSAQPVFP